ncbi:MAG: hypothetical protein KBG28_12215 [Kofleriaceae bacterium]|nr:hypothetical protein [Kofleriaceae bacterium]MBP6840150.1 hypothetical protein [Kofleriaceae bacterium]MBP9204724.1 hypothetical protein [Kofleriaceae bacterium]
MRAHAVAALAVWWVTGCGVVGFPSASPTDGAPGDGPSPPLRATQTGTEILVEVEGRFLLRFAAAREWMAVDWRDATDPDRSLAPMPALADPSRDVVSGLLVSDGTGWRGAGDGQGGSITAAVFGPDRAEFTAEFELAWPSRLASVRATNVITAEGEWTVAWRIEVPGAALAGLEYADLHVDDTQAWTGSTPSSDSYRIRRDGAGPQPTLTVTRAAPLGVLGSDELYNQYWAEMDVDVTSPIERRWTVQLWPPT